jgi:hypothetical protein
MLYPFVKKLPKGHIDENQQQAAERLVRFVPDYELQMDAQRDG